MVLYVPKNTLNNLKTKQTKEQYTQNDRLPMKSNDRVNTYRTLEERQTERSSDLQTDSYLNDLKT